MTKLEKFKEVNAQLNNVLIQMETRLFIENSKNAKEKSTKTVMPKPIVVSKQ